MTNTCTNRTSRTRELSANTKPIPIPFPTIHIHIKLPLPRLWLKYFHLFFPSMNNYIALHYITYLLLPLSMLISITIVFIYYTFLVFHSMHEGGYRLGYVYVCMWQVKMQIGRLSVSCGDRE